MTTDLDAPLKESSTASAPRRIGPYGLEISAELARRLPARADRIVVGNVLQGEPRHGLECARTSLDFVPARRSVPGGLVG
jgi:hypothetical protein